VHMDKIDYTKMAALMDKIAIRLAQRNEPKDLGRRLTADDEILASEAHRAVNAWLYENAGY
jgi:hypothetical protein